jgi:hypothetical protein
MNRCLQIAALVCAFCVPAVADQARAGKEAPPAKPPAREPKNGGNGGGRKLGPALVNPASPAARLFRATPEERERVIEKFPQARQDAIRRNLAWFDGLPKPQQEIVLRRMEKLASFPPEKFRAFQQQMQALNSLPPGRKRAISLQMRALQTMTDQERANVLSSEQFKSRFSPEEQKMIADLSEVMVPQM